MGTLIHTVILAAVVISQNLKLSSHGSFAMAIICRDGLIVAADSRGTLSDSNGRKLAYYDAVAKVFMDGRNAIAYTGRDLIQNLYFGSIVRDFANASPQQD